MIKVNIRQLRRIVQQELGRPLRESEGDITIDVISDFLADRLKTQLFADAPSAIRQFVSSPLAQSAYFPSGDEQIRQMKNQIAQQVMTRLGPLMQQYADAAVQGILKSASQGDVHEAFGSANISDCDCEAPEAEPQGMFTSAVDVVVVEELPDDFSRCSECGFDHEYEWSKSQAWHAAHELDDTQE